MITISLAQLIEKYLERLHSPLEFDRCDDQQLYMLKNIPFIAWALLLAWGSFLRRCSLQNLIACVITVLGLSSERVTCIGIERAC